jgi:hypothetical protein
VTESIVSVAFLTDYIVSVHRIYEKGRDNGEAANPTPPANSFGVREIRDCYARSRGVFARFRLH